MTAGPAAIPLELLRDKAPEAADFLRTLANPNRLILLCRIARGEASVGELQEDLGLKQPGLSQQLAELRQAGLVKTRRESRVIHYSIADGRAQAVMDMLYGVFCAPLEAQAQSRIAGATAPERPEPGAGDAARFARLD